MVPNTRVVLCILFLALIFEKYSSYKIFYADEECGRNGTGLINLGRGSANSSGILKASRDGRHLPDMNCGILLKSALASEIVISIRHNSLMPPNSCHHNYLELNLSSAIQVRLCGYLHDESETQSYFSNANDVHLTFHTKRNGTPVFQPTQFEIVFTAVFSEWAKNCSSEEILCENGKCIWEGLKNDGQNNCGDLSDEITSNLTQENHLSTGMTLIVLIPIIVLSLALIVAIVCCFGHKMTAKIERLIQNEQLRNEARRSIVPNRTARRNNYSTIIEERDVETDNGRNTAAPASDTVATITHNREQQNVFLGHQVNFFSVSDIVRSGENDTTPLPPYDPPPSYEFATKENERKY